MSAATGRMMRAGVAFSGRNVKKSGERFAFLKYSCTFATSNDQENSRYEPLCSV